MRRLALWKNFIKEYGGVVVDKNSLEKFIVEHREKGETYQEIANNYEISLQQVRSILQRNRPDLLGWDILRRVGGKGISEELIVEVLWRYDRGQTRKEISDELNEPIQRVRRIILSKGLYERSRNVSQMKKERLIGEVVKHREKGETYQEIAENCKITPKRVRDILLLNRPDLVGYRTRKVPVEIISRNQEIVRLREQENLTYQEIANKYDVSGERVRQILAKERPDLLGYVKRINKEHQDRISVIVRMRKKGCTIIEIANEVGLSSSRISMIINQEIPELAGHYRSLQLEEKYNQVCKYREQGLSYNEISQKTGFPYQRIWQILNKKASNLVKRQLSLKKMEKRDEEVVRLIEKGVSRKDTAKKVGTGKHNVDRIIQKRAPHLLQKNKLEKETKK